MTPEQLRALQTPLKNRYKEDPSTAKITLRAAGTIVRDAVQCVIDTGKPGAPVGLHPAAGGDGTAACSAEILLEALVGCAGVTFAAVATSMEIAFASAKVVAEGDLDFRGTLGVSRESAVGFTDVRLTFTVVTDAPSDKVKKLVELTERYCVVFQTLAKPPRIEVEFLTGA